MTLSPDCHEPIDDDINQSPHSREVLPPPVPAAEPIPTAPNQAAPMQDLSSLENTQPVKTSAVAPSPAQPATPAHPASDEPKTDPEHTRPSIVTPPPPAATDMTRRIQVKEIDSPRPLGSICGEHYRILNSNPPLAGKTFIYTISEWSLPAEKRLSRCTNPQCGVLYSWWNKSYEPEKFCMICGSALQTDNSRLTMLESLVPYSASLTALFEKDIKHPALRPPLASFQEILIGKVRYCLVCPRTAALPTNLELVELLQQCKRISAGLSHLHSKGFSFDGKIDLSRLGMDGKNMVWVGFLNMIYPSKLSAEHQARDVNALSALFASWLTRWPDLKEKGLSNQDYQTLKNAQFSSAIELEGHLTRILDAIRSPACVDFRIGRRTDVGAIRDLNEDSLLTIEIAPITQSRSQPLGLFLVCDGMGGHAAGEIASGSLVQFIRVKALAGLSEKLPDDPNKWLKSLVESANQALVDIRQKTGSDLGSTLVAALLDGLNLHIAHVGDSRCYKISAGAITCLTQDHSLVQELVNRGQISAEEARNHPQKNVILHTMGDPHHFSVDLSNHVLAQGDRILLCSDGLSGMLEDEDILYHVIHSPSPQAACDALINAANVAGGHDNITAVLIEIVQA
ncbi:MAG TPA: protein phosphatase 2C domain-containing protein [Anaerolineaceae bacterium]|nr:protein phosphatase 2C domain-containing protein [Anaerolineaceae bacterium]HPN50272.1 protein phosphatase 2C domain-containing protein [Anaerolineaceae bacterium]